MLAGSNDAAIQHGDKINFLYLINHAPITLSFVAAGNRYLS